MIKPPTEAQRLRKSKADALRWERMKAAGVQRPQHKDRQREYEKRSREKNREAINARQRKRRAEGKIAVETTEGRRARVLAARDRETLEQREDRLARQRQYGRDSYARNPGATTIRKGRRRARMKGVERESFHPSQVFDRDDWICQLCYGEIDSTIAVGRWRVSLDHIIPISKGGPHTMANTQASHLGCNSSKGDRLWIAA